MLLVCTMLYHTVSRGSARAMLRLGIKSGLNRDFYFQAHDCRGPRRLRSSGWSETGTFSSG